MLLRWCGLCGAVCADAEDSTTKPAGRYTCPMHPDISSSKPGKCPKCQMALRYTRAKVKNRRPLKLFEQNRSQRDLIDPDSGRHHPGSAWQVAQLLSRSGEGKSSRSQLCLYHLHRDLSVADRNVSQSPATIAGRTNQGATDFDQCRSDDGHAGKTSCFCREV